MYELLKHLAVKPEPFSRYTAVELWTKPHLAQQMLKYHLNQDTELASRTVTTIEQIIDWIDETLSLDGKSLCDLGCGPGLYTSRFTHKGATVTGVDLSEKSIHYAREQASENNQSIDYICANYLTDDLPLGFDIVTLIYTDLCVLSPEQRAHLLSRIRKMLTPDGILIFDVCTPKLLNERTEFTTIEANYMGGFWSANDYIGLHRSYIYEPQLLALDHFLIVEPDDRFEIYNWFQYFTPEAIQAELTQAGFDIVVMRNGLSDEELSDESAFIGIIAAKGELPDDDFIKQFEALTLDPNDFSHRGHLRLAWLYLQMHDVDTAVIKICDGIQRYAHSLGATDKFHMTITDALVRIIAKRIEQLKITDWTSFLEHNQDLLKDALAVLDEHFSSEILHSDQAKLTIVPPDKKAL